MEEDYVKLKCGCSAGLHEACIKCMPHMFDDDRTEWWEWVLRALSAIFWSYIIYLLIKWIT